MATAIEAIDIVAARGSSVRERDDRFYVLWAYAAMLLAFVSFLPSYWLQLRAGTAEATPLLHLHAGLFTAWPILLIVQARLIARGKTRNHMALGLAGISLATAMALIGMATAIASMNRGLATGYGQGSLSFLIVPATAIALFAGFFIAAIANIKRPDWHKRFMLVATTGLLQAALVRILFLMNVGVGPGLRPSMVPPRPVSGLITGGLIIDLMIVAGILHDWRTRGRPHPAWLIGLGVFVFVQLVRAPLSTTDAWLAFAQSLTAFG